MPILNHNGAVIGQSPAICRYLAKQFNMMGLNDLEAAQVLISEYQRTTAPTLPTAFVRILTAP